MVEPLIILGLCVYIYQLHRRIKSLNLYIDDLDEDLT